MQEIWAFHKVTANVARYNVNNVRNAETLLLHESSNKSSPFCLAIFRHFEENRKAFSSEVMLLILGGLVRHGIMKSLKNRSYLFTYSQQGSYRYHIV